jgi:hypothetical protein
MQSKHAILLVLLPGFLAASSGEMGYLPVLQSAFVPHSCPPQLASLCMRRRSTTSPCSRKRRYLHRSSLDMGLFDLDFELRWDQKKPLPGPREFELWLDVRPSTLRTAQDRLQDADAAAQSVNAILNMAGRGNPRVGNWVLPPQGQSAIRNVRGPEDGMKKGGAAEEAVFIMSRLYEELLGAGPLLKKCCKGPPVQGILFDYRNVPTKVIGDLPCVTALRDGRLVDVSGDEIGRDLRVSNAMSMLAEAQRYVGQRRYIFIEDVIYGEDPVLRPMLIDEICERGVNNAMLEQTRVLTSVKNIQDLTEGVLLLQYGKEFLRCIGGDRAHIQDLRNKGFLSEDDYAEIQQRGWLPPVLSTEEFDAAGLEREVKRKAEEGRREVQEESEAEEARKAASPWQQTLLFAAAPKQQPADEDLLASDAAPVEDVVHALVLPPDEELWAAALALRAGEMWEREPVEPLSLLFPKELGGVPERLEKHARDAMLRIEKKLEVWEARRERNVAAMRSKQTWSTQGKTKGVDFDKDGRVP